MRDLRQSFLLLLRQFNPRFQDRQYLRDVIATNHLLLVTLERAAGVPAYGGSSVDLKEHLKQFCTPTIVAKYGVALEDFRTNDPVVNNCIFTFLQHVMQSYCLFKSKKENILPYCSVDGSGRHRPSFESFLLPFTAIRSSTDLS